MSSSAHLKSIVSALEFPERIEYGNITGPVISPTNSPTGLECVDIKKKFDLKITSNNNYDRSWARWELNEACSGDLIFQGGEEGKVFCIANKNYVFTIRDDSGAGQCCGYGEGEF